MISNDNDMVWDDENGDSAHISNDCSGKMWKHAHHSVAGDVKPKNILSNIINIIIDITIVINLVIESNLHEGGGHRYDACVPPATAEVSRHDNKNRRTFEHGPNLVY